MSLQANDGYRSLTDKEKQTLRLIAHGHDAKSSARSLGLSVHTINERLREARCKMAVSSSREAARLLLQTEGNAAAPANPDLSVHSEIGEDERRRSIDQEAASLPSGVRRSSRRPLIIGVILMMLALGLSALMLAADLGATAAAPETASAAATSEAAETAQQFLVLLDQGKWDESYRATAASFQQMNTLQVWTNVSNEVRAPLGAAVSRTFLSQENLPAPPDGYEVVKFRTTFASKAAVTETVSLRRENGRWRIAGVIIG